MQCKLIAIACLQAHSCAAASSSICSGTRHRLGGPTYARLQSPVHDIPCYFHAVQRDHSYLLAGEHTVVMLHPLQSAVVEGTGWVDPFVQDFRARFMTLLAGAFKGFTPGLALSLIHPQLTFSEAEAQKSVAQPANIRKADGSLLTAYDLKRLQV